MPATRPINTSHPLDNTLLPPVWTALTIGFAAVLAGLVRGFSGFGTAMIFMPIASTVVPPVMALVILDVMDLFSPIPMVRRALKKAQWRLLLPLWLAAVAITPLGVEVLVSVDPVIVRWMIAVLILVTVGFVASGWRYTANPTLPLTLGVGGAAGFCGGLAGMSGPPVILFWMSGQSDAAGVRANLTIFLFLSAISTGVVLALKGFFTLQAVLWGIAATVPYGLGIFLGSKAFPLASEETFRRIAFAIIIGAVLIGLPLLDPILRR